MMLRNQRLAHRWLDKHKHDTPVLDAKAERKLRKQRRREDYERNRIAERNAAVRKQQRRGTER